MLTYASQNKRSLPLSPTAHGREKRQRQTSPEHTFGLDGRLGSSCEQDTVANPPDSDTGEICSEEDPEDAYQCLADPFHENRGYETLVVQLQSLEREFNHAQSVQAWQLFCTLGWADSIARNALTQEICLLTSERDKHNLEKTTLLKEYSQLRKENKRIAAANGVLIGQGRQLHDKVIQVLSRYSTSMTAMGLGIDLVEGSS